MTKTQKLEQELAVLQSQVKEKEKELDLENRQLSCEYCKNVITSDYLSHYWNDGIFPFKYCNAECLVADLIIEKRTEKVKYE